MYSPALQSAPPTPFDYLAQQALHHYTISGARSGKVIKKLLIIVIIAIPVALVGCNDCSRNNSCNSANNIASIYTCTGGIARSGGPEGLIDEEYCVVCYNTHYLTSNNACMLRISSGESCSATDQCELGDICEAAICRTARYTCSNGNARSGVPNGSADVEYCAGCNSSYLLVGLQCIINRDVLPVTSGSSTDGRISMAGENDYYRVELTGNSLLSAYTEGSSDTYGYLYGDTGNQLATHDDISFTNRNFILSRPLPAGTYYIRVRHFYANSTGDYRLRVAIY